MAQKKAITIQGVDIDNLVISKLIERKSNCKIKQQYLILPKLSGYVKIFKVKDKNDKLMFFRIMMKIFQKNIKLRFGKNVNLKNIELNALPVYDDRYMKMKTRAYGVKFILTFVNYDKLNITNFRSTRK